MPNLKGDELKESCDTPCSDAGRTTLNIFRCDNLNGGDQIPLIIAKALSEFL